jgi:hypothetical protein
VPVVGQSPGHVGDAGHAEHDGASLRDAVELGEFLFGGGMTDGQSFDLA